MFIMYDCASSVLALFQGHVKLNASGKQDLLVKELGNAVLLISQFYYLYYSFITMSALSLNSKLDGCSFAFGDFVLSDPL